MNNVRPSSGQVSSSEIRPSPGFARGRPDRSPPDSNSNEAGKPELNERGSVMGRTLHSLLNTLRKPMRTSSLSPGDVLLDLQ